MRLREAARAQLIFSFRKILKPLIRILLRAGMINSGAQAASARAQSTLLIKPPLADIGLLEWQSFFHAIDRGYQHTLRIVGGPKDALADETPVF